MMEKKLEELREKWRREFSNDPYHQGKSPQQIEEMIEALLTLTRMLYTGFKENPPKYSGT